jgi:hypothetical protein
MNLAATLDLPVHLSRIAGVGPYSAALREKEKEVREHLQRSVFHGWRSTLQGNILQVQRECSESGWDGHGARPISISSSLAAMAVVERLPDGIQEPEVVPEPTGEIGLEWYGGKDLVFTVAVSPDRIVYAGIMGVKKQNGEERFVEEIPETVLGIVSRYFGKA